MQISVIIPTRGRPQRLRTCLQRLARQSMPAHEYEVLLGFDGPDDTGPALAQQAWAEAGGDRSGLKIIVCPRAGLAAVRNALLPFVSGRVLLSMNDDVLAEPQMLAEHAKAHYELGALAVVVGDSPWVRRNNHSVFDAMLEATSMVFFYHRMRGHGAQPHADNPMHDWGFRHAWGLNMSMPTDAARRVGGFTQYPSWYGYEDNEFAFKLRERFGACPVLFRKAALGWHDHAMTPREYLLREYKLGFAALGFTRTSPACSLAMFRRDIASEEEAAKAKQISQESAAAACAMLPWFEGLASQPGSDACCESLQAHYDKHLMLKRWAWNLGLHHAFVASEQCALSSTGSTGTNAAGDIDASGLLAQFAQAG